MKKIDGRTKAGRRAKAIRLVAEKAERRRARMLKSLTAQEVIKISGEWLSPEGVAQMEGVAPQLKEEPWGAYTCPDPRFTDRLFKEKFSTLDAYGPRAGGGIGKATSAYWKVGV